MSIHQRLNLGDSYLETNLDSFKAQANARKPQRQGGPTICENTLRTKKTILETLGGIAKTVPPEPRLPYLTESYNEHGLTWPHSICSMARTLSHDDGLQLVAGLSDMLPTWQSRIDVGEKEERRKNDTESSCKPDGWRMLEIF